MLRWLLSLLLVALWFADARAQVEARSDNFRLVSEAPIDATPILSDLEVFRAAVMTDLGLDPALRAPLTLTLTEDLEMFRDITPGGITAGIYLQSAAGADIVVGYSDTPGHLLERALEPAWLRLVLRHEVVHHIMEAHYPRKVPIWLGEGLAEYYATFDADADGLAVFGRALPEQGDLSALESWLPMRTVIESMGRYPDYGAAGSQSLYASQRLYYGQASALARFVMNQPEGLARVEAFVEGLSEGRDSEDSFESAFGLRFAALEARMRAGLSEDDALRVRALDPPTARSTTVLRLDPRTRDINRQRLLLSYGHKTERVAQAIARRDAALPGDPQALHLARALNAWRRGDWDQSDTYAARVLARTPGEPRALKLRAKTAYGRVSQDQTNEALWADAEAAALAALRAAPDDARLHLFRVAVSLPESDRLPVAALASLDWLQGRDVRLRLPHEAMMMIPALIYEGRFDRADAVLDNAARWTEDPADLFVIERLRDNVRAERARRAALGR